LRVATHCCAVKNVVVASLLFDVADVQFTVEKEGPLELVQLIQKYNLGNSVLNIVKVLRIFLTIAVATCERSFSKLKLTSNYFRSSMGTLPLRNLATLSIEQQLIDRINLEHFHWRICQQKGKKSYCVGNCSFYSRNKLVLIYYTFITIFRNTSVLLFV